MAREDIGERGQWLFSLLMTEFCGRDTPFFRPRFLGDKYPTFDYIVEVVDRPSYFFFVQVKGTRLGYTTEGNRLRVQVIQDDVDRMVACPVPAYVVGIDVNEIGVGFLLSVNEPRGGVASLTTRFRIDCGVLERLRDEVIEFWSSRDMTLAGSHFRE
ncbi:DUF4365 domain-containing protein [Aquisphaera insulae]|uniref:DUF4365 domain-containing protein n=1 Tax=Aquisphaera insulae TaxID=2712864 RepID=UPI0013E9E25E|nr:DUF4365 domain-containing protein [Aquisphaera insulae]